MFIVLITVTISVQYKLNYKKLANFYKIVNMENEGSRELTFAAT